MNKRLVLAIVLMSVVFVNAGYAHSCDMSECKPIKKAKCVTFNAVPVKDNKLTLKTVYTSKTDINPSRFVVKKGVPAVLDIDVKEDGSGCMSAIMIPGLYDKAEPLHKGKLALNFTPDKKGEYKITCEMGTVRGMIKVVD